MAKKTRLLPKINCGYQHVTINMTDLSESLSFFNASAQLLR